MSEPRASIRLAVRPLLAALGLLLVPLIAMQLTDAVDWTAGDFVFAGALVFAAGFVVELAARKTENHRYRNAVGVALAAGFLLIWLTGAVGIIGSADDPANLLYGGVLGVGILGAVVARFRPRGMARAMIAAALAQAAVAAVAIVGGLGAPASGPLELLGLNGFFVALFAVSARLFARVADEPQRTASTTKA